jgi:glutathione transport system substrate-binding protein
LPNGWPSAPWAPPCNSAAHAFAAKTVTLAVYSTFTTLDPYDANDTLSLSVAKSFYQGLFGSTRT